jgi:6-phosphogluconolactonase
VKIKRFGHIEELAKYAQSLATGKMIALSGGSTYREVLSHWSGDFSGQKFYPADERVVEFDHPDCNWKMVADVFLNANGLGEQNAHHQEFMQKSLADNTEFDQIFLGMGDDGHTASLFPQGPELKANTFFVDSIAPFGTRERLSLSLKAIEQAKKVILITYGDQKQEMIFRFIEGDESLPITQAYKRAQRFEFLTLI